MKQVSEPWLVALKIHLSLFQIVSMVSKKTGISDQCQSMQCYAQGGTFIKLENEWRETIKHRNINAKIIKPK